MKKIEKTLGDKKATLERKENGEFVLTLERGKHSEEKTFGVLGGAEAIRRLDSFLNQPYA